MDDKTNYVAEAFKVAFGNEPQTLKKSLTDPDEEW
jgi:hypothetical protein